MISYAAQKFFKNMFVKAIILNLLFRKRCVKITLFEDIITKSDDVVKQSFKSALKEVLQRTKKLHYDFKTRKQTFFKKQ